MHYQIGRLLLQQSSFSQNLDFKTVGSQFFDMVNHLNLGSSQNKDETEFEELAHLNYIAGLKAKDSAAFQSAMLYFKQGLAYLKEDGWQHKTDLCRQLYQETAETAFLIGKFDQMQEWTDLLLQHAKQPKDFVFCYNLRAQALHAKGSLLEAVKQVLKTYEVLGMRFPENPTQWHVNRELKKLRQEFNQTGKAIKDLLHLPPMTDPEKILANLWT